MKTRQQKRLASRKADKAIRIAANKAKRGWFLWDGKDPQGNWTGGIKQR